MRIAFYEERCEIIQSEGPTDDSNAKLMTFISLALIMESLDERGRVLLRPATQLM